MHNRYNVFALLLVLFSLLLTAGTVQGASIKERMASRIPAINALKEQGLIGENNTGYLEYRSSQRPSQALIQEENRDRQTVYAAIAKKEGVSVQLVGQRRAKMIVDKGPSGYWYQKGNGQWYQK